MEQSSWQNTDTQPDPQPPRPQYAPLLDTARLYAGWLLAWYAIVFLLGGQRQLGRLPWDIEWLEGIYRSPLVIMFAFATFLFLLLSTLHRALHGKMAMSIFLTLLWLVFTTIFGSVAL